MVKLCCQVVMSGYEVGLECRVLMLGWNLEYRIVTFSCGVGLGGGWGGGVQSDSGWIISQQSGSL